jgi:hypothetical protein
VLFPAEAAVSAVGDARRAYRTLGADPGDVVHDVVDGGHEWSGRGVAPFLADHLA